MALHMPSTVERPRELPIQFDGEMRTFNDPAQAELVKCAHNVFTVTRTTSGTRCQQNARRYPVTVVIPDVPGKPNALRPD